MVHILRVPPRRYECFNANKPYNLNPIKLYIYTYITQLCNSNEIYCRLINTFQHSFDAFHPQSV